LLVRTVGMSRRRAIGNCQLMNIEQSTNTKDTLTMTTAILIITVILFVATLAATLYVWGYIAWIYHRYFVPPPSYFRALRAELDSNAWEQIYRKAWMWWDRDLDPVEDLDWAPYRSQEDFTIKSLINLRRTR